MTLAAQARLRSAVATVVFALAAPAPAHAQVAAGTTVTNMTASFHGGPYTSLSVYPGNSRRVAIGTADGHLTWSEDGGVSADAAQVLVPRKFDPVTIRSGQRSGLNISGEELDSIGERRRNRLERAGILDVRSLHLFMHLLEIGLQAGRHQIWMQTPDAIAELGDIAWPRGDGPMLLAAQAGIVVSDQSRFSWNRTLGGPNILPRDGDVLGLSVAIDPQNPSHMLAATDKGMQVSDNGGNTWAPHPDGDFEDSWVTRIVWDPDNPQLVFAVTPDTILLSQDGGVTFEASFSSAGEIKDLALSAEAAVVATSEGIQVATSEGINTLIAEKDLIGAIPWRDGTYLAATAEELYLVAADGSFQSILRTTPTDPYLRLAGDSNNGWLLSTYNILRIGDRLERARSRFKARPPRMLLSAIQFERALMAYTGLGDPVDTRLHPRWYAKLVPHIQFRAGGSLFAGTNERRDDIVLPFQVWQTGATAWDRNFWEVFASWDLRNVLLGDNNVSNPKLIIESQIRDKRQMVIDQARWHYRECAALVADLARPPADTEQELLWRMRLEEHASYLEFMSGRKVVERTPIEKLEYME